MKIIAFYLPQFHPIPENNRWWGEGFTEWTNTRRAAPLFAGHYEPREPFGDNYYNLLDATAREWQAEIARAHGIHGFCYYHYWFAGQQLLEKPLNQVLQSGRPDFPFCLSWANEPWSRVWDGRRRDILVPQEYGGATDWRRHFEDVLPALKDPRYIRVGGRPVFIIYRPSNIPRYAAMLDLWRSLARDNGLEGLHLLHALNTFESQFLPGFDGTIDLEPLYTLAHLWRWRRNLRALLLRVTRRNARTPGRRFLDAIDYDRAWEAILHRPLRTGPGTSYLGAFVDWDNTPRRGNRSTILMGATPQKFEHYLARQLSRAENGAGSEFIFVNAWNEWAEGAYLEPDKRFGLQYLEAVRRASSRARAADLEVAEPPAVPRDRRAADPSTLRSGSA
ncbi:MAG: glycoside hydrolase family 99-like domain-containing protein [Thermoplasmata archaeon]|nr:glycoside hydrolase family 99-like domain-containing protein [Thermoplasmata archaeon]